MEQLPETSRSQLFLAVSDLRRIQFLQMIRQGDGTFRYALSPERGDVLVALCCVLQQVPEQVCFGLRSRA